MLENREYLRKSKSIKNMKEITEKIGPRGLIGFGWRVGETVTSVIEGNRSESGTGESYHLVPPRVPYLREAVQEYDGVWTWKRGLVIGEVQRIEVKCRGVVLTGSGFCDVELESTNVDELVLDWIHELKALKSRLKNLVFLDDKSTSSCACVYFIRV